MALSLNRYVGFECSNFNHILKERIEKEQQRSKMTAIKVGVVLSEDVIVEILSWLPVKALLQFKSVCKSWYAIISNSVFISKHIKNYYGNSDSECLIAHYHVTQGEYHLFELLVDDSPRILADQALYNMPLYESYYMCGPCDGIYYLIDYFNDVRALWNPTLNEFNILPPIPTNPDLPSNPNHDLEHEGYGFGYDRRTKDYKVVVIRGSRTTSDEDDVLFHHPLSIFVYSCRIDTWRYWGDLAQYYELVANKCYVFVDGCFYWLGSCMPNGNPDVIISFEMDTDTIQEMQVPDYHPPGSATLGIYDDSIAFMVVHEREEHLDIWTRSEGLWTKKFMMEPIPYVARPVGHWKNKIILEFHNGGLYLCDPKTQEIHDLAYRRFTWCEGVFVYRESLLSLEDMKSGGVIQEDESLRQKSTKV